MQFGWFHYCFPICWSILLYHLICCWFLLVYFYFIHYIILVWFFTFSYSLPPSSLCSSILPYSVSIFFKTGCIPSCILEPISHPIVYTSLSLILPFPSFPSLLVITSLFSISVSLFFFFVIFTNLLCFLDSTYKWYHTVFVLFWLISLSIICSKSIHVAANGKSSFFFMAE